MTQARTKCRRCSKSYVDHLVLDGGDHALCPDSTGRTFQKHINHNLSQSFTPEQIDAADMLFRRATQLRDLHGLVQHKGFAGLAQKFQSMKKRSALKVE